ncbi:MAG: ABC transporter substrate-binding protein, partial [Pseudomonadota bacterium]
NEFDYDFVGRRFAFTPTPGEEIRQIFASTSADTPGSNNMSGIRSSVIDALVEYVLRAEDRDSLNVAGRALDRVLRAGHYWVPQWYKGKHTVGVWDEFGWPENQPRYDFPVERIWWYDTDKAARIGRG